MTDTIIAPPAAVEGLRLQLAHQPQLSEVEPIDHLAIGRQYQRGERRALPSVELVVALMGLLDESTRLTQVFREGFEARGQMLFQLTHGTEGREKDQTA